MIKAKFDPKYQMLLEAFDKELDQVKIIFDTDKVIWLVKKPTNQKLNLPLQNDPPLHKNQPPIAGRLKWANELLNRINDIHKVRSFLIGYHHLRIWLAKIYFRISHSTLIQLSNLLMQRSFMINTIKWLLWLVNTRLKPTQVGHHVWTKIAKLTYRNRSLFAIVIPTWFRLTLTRDCKLSWEKSNISSLWTKKLFLNPLLRFDSHQKQKFLKLFLALWTPWYSPSLGIIPRSDHPLV